KSGPIISPRERRSFGTLISTLPTLCGFFEQAIPRIQRSTGEATSRKLSRLSPAGRCRSIIFFRKRDRSSLELFRSADVARCQRDGCRLARIAPKACDFALLYFRSEARIHVARGTDVPSQPFVASTRRLAKDFDGVIDGHPGMEDLKLQENLPSCGGG